MVKFSSASLDATFSALSDPTRRGILGSLTQGWTSISDLSQPYAVSAPAITKHLRVLKRAGLIQQKKIGRTRYCRLQTAPLGEAMDCIEFYRRFWKGRLDALDVFVKKMKAKRKKKK